MLLAQHYHVKRTIPCYYTQDQKLFASTKAYTAQIAVLAILAKAIGEERQTLAAVSFDVAHELSVVAAVTETLIDENNK